jgi:glycosyltransferase involved in cell wall biosynthesis
MPLDPASRPRISAVIPTHNDAGRIVDALASIAAQTMAPAQIVVSDDASTDGTEEVVARFSAQCPIPIHYMRHTVRAGVVATRNEGIDAATGDWIANCDSDDYWAATKLERQIAFLDTWAGPPITLLGTHGFNVNDNGRIISPALVGASSEEECQRLRDHGGIPFVIHSSALFARADFMQVGRFTEEYESADDLHFFCKISRIGMVVVLPELLTFYRKRAGSVQIVRFWNQYRQLDRLATNESRRVHGEPLLDLDEFLRLKAAGGPRTRLLYWLDGCAKYQYRRGAMEFVNGRRVGGAARMGLAILLGREHRFVSSGVMNALRYRLRRPTSRGDRRTQSAS